MNASQIGKGLGLRCHTVNHYTDYLEQAYLIRKLPPWHANIKNVWLKAKRYTGGTAACLHALMHLSSCDALLMQPRVGVQLGGLCHCTATLMAMDNAGKTIDVSYFFRTRNGDEIDLVFILKWEK